MARVYFVYEVTSLPYGGANTFNRLLSEYFQKNQELGIEIVFSHKLADVIFLNAASRGPVQSYSPSLKNFPVVKCLKDRTISPWQLWNLRSRRPLNHPIGLIDRGTKAAIPMVQRLDGVTFRYGRSNGERYDRLQVSLNRQASFTVFQTGFCKESFMPMLGNIKSFEIVHNGADGSVFKWSDRIKPVNKINLLASSWSNNPRKGHRELVTLAELPNVEVTFIGRWPIDLNSGNVHVLPPTNQTQLAGLMSSFHVFVHLAQNDPAPNSVIEALASGLPVLYLDSGGTPEIVQGDRWGQPVHSNTKSVLSDALDCLMARYENIIEKLKENHQTFLIDEAAKKYAAVFNRFD